MLFAAPELKIPQKCSSAALASRVNHGAISTTNSTLFHPARVLLGAATAIPA
jgi:hypothetical protein